MLVARNGDDTPLFRITQAWDGTELAPLQVCSTPKEQ